MNRRSALFASVLLLGSALASSAVLADDIHLTWLATTGQSPHSNNPAAKAWFTDQLAAWEKAHPGVTIDISYQAQDINAAMTRLQEQAAAGRAPDFASLDSFFLSRFYDKLQPLDSFYTKDDIDDFVPFASFGMHDSQGHLKALWVNTDVRALFYRTDVVKTPPKTWDEMLATGADLKKQGLTAYVFPGGRQEAATMEHLPMFWAMGGKLVDDNGAAVFGQGDNRAARIKILTFLKTLVDNGVSPTRVSDIGSENDEYPEIMRGQTAMFLGGSWMPNQLKSLGDKHEWGIAPIPMNGAVGPSTAAGGWTFGVFTPGAEKQKLAVDFINFVAASKDGMAGAVTAESNLPTRKSVAAMDTPYLNQPNVKTFSSMLAYGQARPGAAIYPTISTELQVAISSTVTGQKTPEKAIDDAWARVQQQSGK